MRAVTLVLSALTALCIVTIPASSDAKPLKWVFAGASLDNYSFSGGPDPTPPIPLGTSSTVSGWFVYDAQTNDISSCHIDVDGHLAFISGLNPRCRSDILQACDVARWFNGSLSHTDEIFFNHDSSPSASLFFGLIVPTLTDRGGSVTISDTSEYRCCNYELEGGSCAPAA